MSTLKAPFPWFGGKASIAPLVWERFGTASNYVEPFFGSGAMLLGRPNSDGTETVNDLDGYLANFWRAIQAAPDEVARHADWPVNECDLHARHAALVRAKPEHVARLMGDPDYYDANLAGWWVWGLCSWIGSGWCSGQGPWQVIDGALANARKLPHLGDAGRGIYDTFAALSARLRGVRVCCGDWSRVCGPSVTVKHGLTAVFLDPPYSETAGREKVYTHDCMKVAHDVREWAIASGSNPLLRIALAGYEGEHAMPDDWQCVAWKASGGYEGQGKEPTGNCRRERLWFSPHCEKPELLLL